MQKSAQKNVQCIYVPGLGRRYIGLQGLIVKTWRLWGVRAELHAVGWEDQAAWEPKLQRLLVLIDSYSATGTPLMLVGASAGAAAVICAFEARADVITGCVLIAGKVLNPASIGLSYHESNPAFIAAAYGSERALHNLAENQRRKIVSIYSQADKRVSWRDSKIDGSTNIVSQLPTGHSTTIVVQLLFGAHRFFNLVRAAVAE